MIAYESIQFLFQTQRSCSYSSCLTKHALELKKNQWQYLHADTLPVPSVNGVQLMLEQFSFIQRVRKKKKKAREVKRTMVQSLFIKDYTPF